ncbi:MAG: hypothetical protein NUV80_05325 [Candidatus Berkelbacteria bacterium]|nr:hypothetical protein [Candidatus Berkelbacteria bacterium]MCR4307956.1 hypothetical protein [Candidatus Berkelbacteria bacterium]
MLIFIHGTDSFLARDAISKLKAKYLEKNPDGVELIEIDATEPMRNWADLKASPLFATSRLIIVKQAGELLVDEQNNLASMLIDLPSSSVVVLWDGKPLKAKSSLSIQVDKATKIINAEPLMGPALRNWIKTQATELGFEVTPELINELVDQYGSDLWGIQTDLKTRQGSSSISSWGRAQTEKPFALFDYVRGQRWSDLRKHLILSHQRGEAVEMTIGSLAAAVRKSVSDPTLKRKMTETLSEIDIALKTGLIESGDAVALLACYLPDGQHRVQWEVAWESLT